MISLATSGTQVPELEVPMIYKVSVGKTMQRGICLKNMALEMGWYIAFGPDMLTELIDTIQLG